MSNNLEARLKSLEEWRDHIAQALMYAPQAQGKSNEAAAVNEVTFTQLKWEPQKSDKLGEFDIATQEANKAYGFADAYQILKVNNATIKDRYHGEGYAYSYWLYGENKIYRQKLKPKQ